MNKSELISTLEASRKTLLVTIDGLSDEEMTTPGVMGDWSVKDLLSHITAWEAELVTMLAQARQGKKPPFADVSPSQTDALNAQWRNETKDRPLERVLADFHGVRKQTVKQVESFSDEELNDPKLYKWLKDSPLWKWIANETFEHEAEHAEQIIQWREERNRR
ncbi:MAG TPA: ClbS/DfsB family four-helix bundle protein [Anaerolineales bacterium]|nr:ClbS/DfsB family four-helix bundle protein [Anaerolineales bacterium]